MMLLLLATGCGFAVPSVGGKTDSTTASSALIYATEPVPGGSLDPSTLEKYTDPLIVPATMPMTVPHGATGNTYDYYEIALR